MHDPSILDAFRTLHLSPDATLKEVRHAYRTLVRSWHPDRYAHDPNLQQAAQERLKEINAAYHIARKNIASPRTEIDSPFRFDLVPKPATPTKAPGQSNETSGGGKAGNGPVQPLPLTPGERPALLNVMFLLLILAAAMMTWRRHGISLPGFSQFLLVVTIPGLCAILCNSRLSTRQLRRGYCAAIVLAAVVLLGDAVSLHRTDTAFSIPGSDEGGSVPYADAPSFRSGSIESDFTLGPADRSGAHGVRPPMAPVSPAAPSVSPPAPPAPPHAPLQR